MAPRFSPGPEGVSVERWFTWSALLFLGAAMLLLLLQPRAMLAGGGQGALSAFVHLITLGGLLGGYYPLQSRLWSRLYGRPPFLPVALWLIWGLHTGGVALLAWGFYFRHALAANLGGHYLVPSALALALLQGAATACFRPSGKARHLAAHLPGLGLLVTLSLGALMVMDGYTGQYGIYTRQTILVHMVSGAFLFFLPFALVLQAVDDGEETDAAAGPFSATVPTLLPGGLGALGVLAIAQAGMNEAYSWAFPAGLGLLGATGVWIGLPALGPGTRPSLRSMRRSLWGALGLLLLFAAIRGWRGAQAGEAQGLALAAVTLFLFGVALPEILIRLLAQAAAAPGAGGIQSGETEPESRPLAVLLLLLLFAAGMLLVAQLAAAALLVQAVACLWIGALLWMGRMLAAAPLTNPDISQKASGGASPPGPSE